MNATSYLLVLTAVDRHLRQYRSTAVNSIATTYMSPLLLSRSRQDPIHSTSMGRNLVGQTNFCALNRRVLGWDDDRVIR
ncbi:hypothetical protein [Chamaesiphon polymorphus]|uniref:hypothetical protein n=1 Tax=Chamaesiphon polymorphus TaxID=2107691 RepID=UPI0011B23AF2|nr:hypothetical protein [Chamaesiphon polymorphus]